MTMLATQPQGGGGMIVLRDEEERKLEQLEQVAQESQIALAQGGQFVRAIKTARAIAMIRSFLTDDVMRDVMALMNTPLGFKTDKDPHRGKKNRETGQWENPTPYALPVVRDCVIVATLRGASLVGNEFNIISGQTYLTKEYFTRVLGQLDGVTDIVESPGIPRQEGGKTLVRFGLSWKKNGTPDSLKGADGTPGRVFAINADQYSGADQILGKATRKAYAAAYRQITGSTLTGDDGDVTDFVEGQVVNPNNHGHKSDGAAKLAELRAQQQQGSQPPAGASGQVAPTSPPPVSKQPDAPKEAEKTEAGTAGEDSKSPTEDEADLPRRIADMVPAEFEKLIREKAIDNRVSKGDFNGGIFKFVSAKGKANLAGLDDDERMTLYAAVVNDALDWKTGKVQAAAGATA